MLKRSACLFLVCLSLLPTHRASADPALDGLTLVIVDAPDIAALHRARVLVQENGGRVGVMVPPSVLIGWIDPTTAAKLVGREGIRDIRWSETATSYRVTDEPSLSAIESFNTIVSGEYERRRRAPVESLGSGAGTAPRRDAPDALAHEASNVSDVLDNLRRAGLDESTLFARGLLPRVGKDGASSFSYADQMTGVVGVTFFLVESDGTGSDPDSWTWTPEDMQEYMDATVAGLLWWTGRAAGYRDCWVTFLINHVSAFDPRCQQWVEPSLHNNDFVSTWASNVMTKMGYTSGNHFSKVDAFNTWQEATYQVNSAYSAFIAYNPIGAPSSFANGGYAFAWIYGPYFWSLFRTPGWTHDVVISHESGHIFGACDEYTGGCSSCVGTCSAYGGANGNCEDCNPMSRPCMMRSNENSLCQYTKTMIGWDENTPCAPAPPAPLPAPTLALVSPPTGLEGTEINVTLTGSNFVAGVEADLGPEVFVHTTTRVNATTLEVWASVFNGAALGLVDVAVRNADGQTATLVDAFEILPTRRHYFSPSGGDVFPYLSPVDAGTSLSDVIGAAVGGDTVLVPTMTFSAFSLGIDRGVTVQGAWNASFTARNLATGKTVIDLAGIIDFYPSSDGAALDGFLVENGDGKADFLPVNARYAGAVRVFQTTASIRNCEIRNSSTGDPSVLGMGGAIYAYQSTLNVENCRIHDNSATKGGALYLDQCSGSIVGSTIDNNVVVTTGIGQPEGSGVYALASTNVALVGNTIGHNTGGQNGGGILAENSSAITIEGGTIEYNGSSLGGGGIAFKTTSGEVRGARVRRNTSLLSGGILLSGGGSCIVEDCRIEWNTGTYGGGLFGDGTLFVSHNLFVGNSAANICGALGVSNVTDGIVAGNTVDRNSGGAGTGGIYLAGAAIPVFDNIVTNSGGAGISCSGSAPAFFDYNNVWNATGTLYAGCAPGAASISSDPLFADTTAGDYHLVVHSPCIDRGRTGGTYDDPDGSRGDMGAYGAHAFAMDQPAYVKNLGVAVAGADRILAWDANSESDVAQYAVYADASSGFVPSAANFVAFVTTPTSTFNAGPVAADTYYRVNAIDDDGYAGGYSGEASASPSTDVDPEPIAYRTRLLQNVPNPFNPVTEIRFELATAADVSITIFDAAGRLVRTLEHGNRAMGNHTVRWNGTNDGGEPVSSGVYFYRMRAAGFDETRKMILLK